MLFLFQCILIVIFWQVYTLLTYSTTIVQLQDAERKDEQRSTRWASSLAGAISKTWTYRTYFNVRTINSL